MQRCRRVVQVLAIGFVLALLALEFPAPAHAQGASVSVCGTVSAYVAPTALLNGLVVIGGQTIPIAAGTTITGEGLIAVGSNVCLQGALNVAGLLVAPASVTANATVSVRVCGTVSAYAAATASSPGSVTIGGQTLPIAAGTQIDGAGLLTAGADVCLNGTVNALGQLVAPSTVTADLSGSVQVCGTVSEYAAATASGDGSITIGGRTFPIAAGTTLDGAGLISLGADLCLSGTLDASGRLVAPSSLSAAATTAIEVCGVVTAYTAATASSAGTITIGGQTIPIAAGTTLDGSGLVAVGANLCLHGRLDASGRLVAPSSVTANAGVSIRVCGVVTAYTAATASSAGSITIDGRTIAIAAATNLDGSGQITIGANVCLNGSLDASGSLVPPSSVSIDVSTTVDVDVCGVVSAFTPATATSAGSLTVGGQTFTIAPGTSLHIPVSIGAVLCANLSVTPGGGGSGSGGGAGQIVGGEARAVGSEILFPIAARVVGVGGSHWTTDLRIVNLGPTPASVTIEWYPFSPGGRPAPVQAATVIVGPGVQGTFDGAVESLFHTEGGGSLRLISESTTIGAALRLFHDRRAGACGGAFGMFAKGLRGSEAVSRGALLVLSNRPGDEASSRSNLGYFNGSSQPLTLTFSVFATDGRLLGEKTLTVAGFANDQRNVFDIVDTVTATDRMQRDLYVTFRAEGGLPFVYGSAVYNSTHDALFVTPWQY